MPVYLLHGFRWPRQLIRIHVILQNLDDVAAEWLVAPGTTQCLLENFEEVFPHVMEHLPNLRFAEQYDPDDTGPDAGSQPFAYVADVCHEIKLGIDVDEVRGKGVGNDQWAALLELRDKLAPEEKVGWFIVVCGDEERASPDEAEEAEEAEGAEEVGGDKALPRTPSIGSPMTDMPSAPHQNGTRRLYGTDPKRTLHPADGTNGRSTSGGQQNGGPDREPARRPQTAGSSFTSKSSAATRKDYSSPDMSRKSFSSPEVAQSNHVGPEPPEKGFKKLIGAIRRRKSRVSIKDVSSPASTHSQFGAPPMPPLPQQRV